MTAAAPPAGPPSSLEVDDLWKSFGRVEVLRGVSFAARAGELLTVLGPSGCGKTTLLRIVAGLELADRGGVRIGGRAVDHLPAQRRPVNTVFQSYALFPHLAVFENVAFGLRSLRVAEAELRRRVGEALALLQLEALAARLPEQLSGGQKQRVALARALVNEPEVLLLDEPLSALDARLRAQLRIELRRLQRALGRTFVLVTHDQDEAMTVSDRIMVMQDGAIAQIGPPAEVYERPVSRFVAEFLGAANLIAAEREGAGPGGRVTTPLGPLELRAAPAWQRGTLAIRPERVRLADGPPEHNGLRVTVREWVYRGDHLDVWVEPGPLRLRTAPSLAVTRDQPLWVELPAEHLEALVD